MVVRIAFYRANPRSGLINVVRGPGQDGAEVLGAELPDLVPLPGCLEKMLAEKVGVKI